MKTLMITVRNERDAEFIKEMLSKFDVDVVERGPAGEVISKSKFKSPDELRAMGGILKGQLISKEHLCNLSWKKRNY